jgi:hypothetical protein
MSREAADRHRGSEHTRDKGFPHASSRLESRTSIKTLMVLMPSAQEKRKLER